MEYVEGRTLAEKVAGGPLPLKDLLGVATEIAEALEVAHDHGIVHRDLKPGEHHVGARRACQGDGFGLAKQSAPLGRRGRRGDTATTALTEVGRCRRHPDYMAPEQLRGEEVDARADIFSLGIILIEMLTGRNPLRRSSKWKRPAKSSANCRSLCSNRTYPIHS